jgi:hypothetical protein
MLRVFERLIHVVAGVEAEFLERGLERRRAPRPEAAPISSPPKSLPGGSLLRAANPVSLPTVRALGQGSALG